MMRKKPVNYFEGFVNLMEYTCEAANLLHDIFQRYNVSELEEKMEEMHAIEHSADIQRRIFVNKLARDFITPLEREDIMDLADAIDNITDNIEDVLLRLYMYNISAIREDGQKFTSVIVKCCNSLKHMLEEFHNYKKSEKINDLIYEVNRLEEVGDKLFTESIRNLYVTCKDPIEIMSWDQTLHYLESCCDACEDASNIVESVIMKAK